MVHQNIETFNVLSHSGCLFDSVELSDEQLVATTTKPRA
jgi:hypothetical protein